MARKSRTSVLKRQREAQKRQRERRKQEKAAIKRERRHGNTDKGTPMASQDDLVGLGLVEPPPPPAEGEEEPDS